VLGTVLISHAFLPHSGGGNSLKYEARTPHAPAVIDMPTDDDFVLDHRLAPGSIRRGHADVGAWRGDINGSAVIVFQLSHALRLSNPAKI